MGKPTVHDIAREAGVSLATVDRVINARAGVRARTVDRVNTAIEKLGFVRDMSAANLARRREYRYLFMLPDGPGQFVSSLRDAILEANAAHATDRTSMRLQNVPTNDPHQIVRVLQQVDSSNTDGVVIMAPETPQLRDAIARLRADGVAVIALVSDLPNSGCDHFVGINNLAAGRTAAVLMGRFAAGRAGKVLVVANSMQLRDSLERRLGFDSLMSEEFPDLQVLPSLECYNDPDRTEDIIRAALSADEGILGVYILSSGVKAVLSALQSSGRLEELIVLAHELTPYAREALSERHLDAVITQDVGHLVRSAVRVLRAKTDGLTTIASQERIRIEVVLKENMP